MPSPLAFNWSRRLNIRILFFYARAAQRGLFRMPYRKHHRRNRTLQKIKYDGAYTFLPGDRIYEAILKIVHIMDAILVAMEFTNSTDPVSKDTLSSAHYLVAESFDVEIKVPLKTPMEYLARSELPRFVQITVVPKPKPFQLIKMRRQRMMHAPMIMTGLLTPIFVDFFEQHRPFLVAKFGGDPKLWPPIANFVRVIRNFIVHHQGRVHFDNPNAPAVSWHHLSYEPKDDVAVVAGAHGDIGLGDIVLLLMEFTGELDDWGCPALTMSIPHLERLARVHRQGPDNPEYRDLVAKFGPLPRRRPL